MTFNVSLIQLNGKVNSTKNAVISVLADKWPLSAKQIFNESNERFNLNVSYQAIHKTIKALEEEQIIVKSGSNYKLNEEWIEKAKDFSEQLSESYSRKGSEPSLVFSSLYEVDRFLLNTMMEISPKEDEKPFLGLHWNHFWIPLFLSIKEYNLIKENMPKFEVYALCRGNTSIDRWCGNFWGKRMVKHKTGVDVAAIADIVVYGDMIIEVFYPTKIKKELDDFYNKAKGIDDLNVDHLFNNIFQKKTEIHVVIHKNKTLADQLKEQTLGYFGGIK